MREVDGIADLYELPPLVEHDVEYFGEVVGIAGDEIEAMAVAARHGTTADRWVDQGVAGNEYHDLVTARRSTSR